MCCWQTKSCILVKSYTFAWNYFTLSLFDVERCQEQDGEDKFKWMCVFFWLFFFQRCCCVHRRWVCGRRPRFSPQLLAELRLTVWLLTTSEWTLETDRESWWEAVSVWSTTLSGKTPRPSAFIGHKGRALVPLMVTVGGSPVRRDLKIIYSNIQSLHRALWICDSAGMCERRRAFCRRNRAECRNQRVSGAPSEVWWPLVEQW